MRVLDSKFSLSRRICSVVACMVLLGGLAMGQVTGPATGQKPGFPTGQRPYWEMMQDKIVDYKATVAAFNAYWAGRTPGKGQGYKVFQRWAYINGLRVQPDGTLPAASAVAAEMERWGREYAHLRRTSLTPSGNWTAMGPVALPTNNTGQPNGIGRTTTIAFHPTDPNRLYVGTPNGGLWASTDGGATWATQTDFLPTLGVSAILVDPVTPATMYIGTGDKDANDASGLGVYKTTNGGTTWTASSTGMGDLTVHGMRFDPDGSSTVIAATTDGIYRSTNGGANWIQTLASGTTYQVTYRPGSTNTLYAANKEQFFTSTDDGATWNAGVTVSTSARTAFAVTAANPNHVYMVKDVGSNPVFRSTDGGLSFTNVQTDGKDLMNGDCDGAVGPGQGWYDICISVDPANANNVMVGGVSLWKSTDGGVNFAIAACWSDMATNVHADHHALAYSPHHPSRLYDCNDGGVYYTDNFGTAYSNLSSGIAASQIYRVGLSGSDPGMLVAGFQDNGTAISRQPAWTTTEGGDGLNCAIDPTDNQFQYGSYVFGDIYRSTDAGFSWTTIANNGIGGIDETGPWLTPYALQPGNPNVMVAGYTSIWRSSDVKDASPSFTNVQAFAFTTIRDVHFADANTVYASCDNGEFWQSTDAGLTWNQGADTPGDGAKDIAADPANPNNVWVAAGNDIYRSTDGGTNWTLWDTGLPDISALTVVYDRVSNALYCGMWTGVYYRLATDPSWVPYNAGLPNTQALHLQIFYDQGGCVGRDMLRLATYGRGIWQSDLRSSPTRIPVACFGADKTTVCAASDTLQLRDSSAHDPTGWNWTVTGSGPVTFVNGTGPTSQNPQVTLSTDGLYTVTLVATNANGSSTKVRNNYLRVVINLEITCPENVTRSTDTGLCSAAVTYNPASTVNCTGATTILTEGLASGAAFPVGTTTNTFSVTANGQTTTCSFTVTIVGEMRPVVVLDSGRLTTTLPYESYQWYLDGTLLAGAIESSYTPAAAGWYSVAVEDSNGCRGTSDSLYHSPVGMAEGLTGQDVLRVYPNPTSGLLEVELSCRDCVEGATYALRVSDLMGRMLMTTNVLIEGGEGSARLNLGDCSAGIYLIRVNDLVHRVMRQ
jgi:photosystem II stability/assembly factor-like uncharacterized protein